MSDLQATAEAYWMGHRPSRGAPAYDLLADDPEQGEPLYPADIYDKPQYYCGYPEHLPETMATLRAARGKPSATITVYRAQKSKTGLNPGDWVTLSKRYAEQDLASEPEGGTRSVETYKVPASTVEYAGDDLMEWGYWGSAMRTAALTAVVAAEDHSDSVMVCLRPSDAACEAIAAMAECTEPIENLHLTLFYFGTTEDAGGEWGKERLYRGLYDFAIHSGYSGVTGTLNGFGVFSNEEDSLVSLWDIPKIAEFRTHLMDKVRDHGVPVREEDHGFTPHLTMATGEKKVRNLPEIPEIEPEQFDSIWMVWGEEWTEVTLI